MSGEPVLEVRNLSAGYGKRAVIANVSFEVQQAEILAIIGPNGSGKSTLLKAIMSLNRIFDGEIVFYRKNITAYPTHRKVSDGIIYLPQGNRAFDDLTVMENLLMGGYTLLKAEVKGRVESVLEMFPELKAFLNRPAYTLSGGERQMLAFARALILKPRLLLLDEPSVGLEPKLVKEVMEKVVSIRDELSCGVLVVEQKVREVFTIADQVIAMRMGEISVRGTPEQLRAEAKSVFLG